MALSNGMTRRKWVWLLLFHFHYTYNSLIKFTFLFFSFSFFLFFNKSQDLTRNHSFTFFACYFLPLLPLLQKHERKKKEIFMFSFLERDMALLHDGSSVKYIYVIFCLRSSCPVYSFSFGLLYEPEWGNRYTITHFTFHTNTMSMFYSQSWTRKKNWAWRFGFEHHGSRTHRTIYEMGWDHKQ